VVGFFYPLERGRQLLLLLPLYAPRMTPTNVLSATQTTALDAIYTKVFNFVVNFLYSLVMYIVDFFTKPEVLGSLVVIALVYGAYSMLKRRKAMA
jgi:hypothetical protein